MTTPPTPLLDPFARVPCVNHTDLVDAGDGTVAFLGADERFVFVDADGVVVDELEMPERGMHPGAFASAQDGLITGVDGLRGGVLFARRGAGQVKLCRHDDFRLAYVAPIAGVGALLHTSDRAGILREDLVWEPLRLPFANPRTFARNGLQWWHHDLLVTSCVERDERPDDLFGDPDDRLSDHHVHCIGGDGVVRFEATAAHVHPLDDDLALLADAGGRGRVIDRDGAIVHLLDERLDASHPYRPPCRYQGDLVLSTIRGPDALARLTPRTASTPRWWTRLPELPEETRLLATAVAVGDDIVVARRARSDRLYLIVVDAGSGAVVARHEVPDIKDSDSIHLMPAVHAGGAALLLQNQRWDGTSLLLRDVRDPAPLLTIASEGRNARSHMPKPGVLVCKMTSDVRFYRLP